MRFQSAISQIHESREVIVVDDASSDGSDSVLKSYGEMIRLISLERNEGASEARNAGTAAARGNYLVYLDGDDLLKPWALLVYETRKCDCAGYLEPGIIVAFWKYWNAYQETLSGSYEPSVLA